MESNQPPSLWSPLRHRLFSLLWAASLASNIGSCMHDAAAAWLMTALSLSPLMIAMLQTSATLPMFLLALPAGALADVVDRRRLLLATQAWMTVAAALLGALTLAGLATPDVLLVITFLMGVGAAANLPGWQSITAELVPRRELTAASALGGVGFNIARSAGPLLAGLILGMAGHGPSGPGAVFVLNALSFGGVIAVLYSWDRPIVESVLPAERVMGAMRAGLRYARHSPGLQSIFARTAPFVFCASALWSQLALVARVELRTTSTGYGLLLGSLGLGAVLGAAWLTRIRQRLSLDGLAVASYAVFAAVLLALASVHSLPLLCGFLVVGGAAWMAMMSSLGAAVQLVAPSWVRSRALSLHLLVFMGGFTGGSLAWGVVAAHLGLPRMFQIAAGGMVLGLVATWGYRLLSGEDLDLSPSRHWPMPDNVSEPAPGDGPVLVTVEYRIDPARAADFARVMHEVRRICRRDGALQWALYHDVADPARYLETFVVENWAEHLRQHERVTVADEEVERRAHGFHVGEGPRRISHFVAGIPRSEPVD